MMSVFKYQLPDPCDVFQLMLPVGAEVLHVDQRYLWARADTKVDLEPRFFRWAGTGHSLGRDVGAHVGSWLEGPFVWHLFEIVP